MSNSDFEVKGIYPRTREQDRLQKVVDEIQQRRKDRGQPEIRDAHEFTSQLLTLANSYKALRQEHEESEAARKRFSEIGKLTEKLKSELSGLSELERKQLWNAQGRLFCNFDDLDEAACAHRYNLDLIGYELRNFGYATEDFTWLAAAKSLSKARARARPRDSIEKRIAQEFVVLCHQHGWSPIGVSRSGTEHDGASPRPSDSVLLFAAVLEAGGCRYESKAVTALESLRDKFEYVVGPTWEEHGMKVYDGEECIVYEVNLRAMRCESSYSIGSLPRFAPED